MFFSERENIMDKEYEKIDLKTLKKLANEVGLKYDEDIDRHELLEILTEIILGRRENRYPRDDCRRFSVDRLDEACAFFERVGCNQQDFYNAIDNYVNAENKIYEKLKSSVEEYNNSYNVIREKFVSYFLVYMDDKNKSLKTTKNS